MECIAVLNIRSNSEVKLEDLLALEQYLNTTATIAVWKELQLGVRFHIREKKGD